MRCTYDKGAVPKGAKVYDVSGAEVPTDGTGSWASRICRDAEGNEVRNTLVYLRRRTPAQLAQEARDYVPLPLPDVGMSPPPDRNLVNLRTYLWVPAEAWAPRSASATVPGASVSVSAVPERVVWQLGAPGKHDTVVCSGPGTPYDFAKAEDAQDTSCSYLWQRPSGTVRSGRFPVSVTVEWRASWSGGDLGIISRTSTVMVRVYELHALEVPVSRRR